MSATITLSEQISAGSERICVGTGNLGTYVNTGGNHGVSVTVNQFGMSRIDKLIIDPAGGYFFEYVPSTGRIKAYGNDGVAAHTHDLFIKGGQAAGSTADIAYYATDILGKEAATDKTIAGADSATKGGVLSSTVPSSGDIGAEVDNSTDLSSAIFNWRAYGA